ncbi:MAG: DUF2804 domain-containing protein [Ruminococcus sp.]|nr:DUF2804 domain-containing protein [Ruminococcus sp.]
MQSEITKITDVFDSSGQVSTVGWSKQPVFVLDKSHCKKRMSFYERDSYMITNDRVSIYLTVSENGANSEISIVIADHETGNIDSRTLRKYMSFGKLDMPATSKNGDVTFADTRAGVNFSNTALKRYIRCDCVDFSDDKNLYINIALEEGTDESLNTLIPAKKNKRNFYLKRFLPALRPSGVVRCGGAEYTFTPEDSFAFLDWQRCLMNDKSCHHGLYADTRINGHQFSLCLAGGIGNTFKGSENCYFYDGKIHKLASVKADGNDDKLDKTWHFTAGSSALDITFRPEIKGGHLMAQKCASKTIVFGRLQGTIQQYDTDPVVLDAVPAHIEFSMI